MLISRMLRPVGWEEFTLISGCSVLVPKANPCSFSSWSGPPIADSSCGKPVLEFKGKPLFAELAILRILETDGWNGVWVDSYRRRF